MAPVGWVGAWCAPLSKLGYKSESSHALAKARRDPTARMDSLRLSKYDEVTSQTARLWPMPSKTLVSYFISQPRRLSTGVSANLQWQFGQISSGPCFSPSSREIFRDRPRESARCPPSHQASRRMNVAVVGLWHLGCVTAASLAAGGHDVAGVDFDADTPTLSTVSARHVVRHARCTARGGRRRR